MTFMVFRTIRHTENHMTENCNQYKTEIIIILKRTRFSTFLLIRYVNIVTLSINEHSSI